MTAEVVTVLRIIVDITCKCSGGLGHRVFRVVPIIPIVVYLYIYQPPHCRVSWPSSTKRFCIFVSAFVCVYPRDTRGKVSLCVDPPPASIFDYRATFWPHFATETLVSRAKTRRAWIMPRILYGKSWFSVEYSPQLVWWSLGELIWWILGHYTGNVQATQNSGLASHDWHREPSVLSTRWISTSSIPRGTNSVPSMMVGQGHPFMRSSLQQPDVSTGSYIKWVNWCLLSLVSSHQSHPTSSKVKMFKLSVAFVTASLFALRVSAQSPIWGQCGGQGWTGATTCEIAFMSKSTSWYWNDNW